MASGARLSLCLRWRCLRFHQQARMVYHMIDEKTARDVYLPQAR